MIYIISSVLGFMGFLFNYPLLFQIGGWLGVYYCVFNLLEIQGRKESLSAVIFYLIPFITGLLTFSIENMLIASIVVMAIGSVNQLIQSKTPKSELSKEISLVQNDVRTNDKEESAPRSTQTKLMKEKIKDFLYGLGGIGFIVLITIAFSLLIIGGVKLFEQINPILERISSFIWSIVWLLVILSIIPRFRNFTGTGIIFGTYVGGAIFWFLCFYITYSLWGLLGIFIGVLFLGLGVFLTAVLALLFNGQFMGALDVIFILLQILLLRYLGFWIITKYKSRHKLETDEVESEQSSRIGIK